MAEALTAEETALLEKFVKGGADQYDLHHAQAAVAKALKCLGVTYCAYCEGFEVGTADPDCLKKIGEHVLACPKHPLAIALAEVDRLLASNEALRRVQAAAGRVEGRPRPAADPPPATGDHGVSTTVLVWVPEEGKWQVGYYDHTTLDWGWELPEPACRPVLWLPLPPDPQVLQAPQVPKPEVGGGIS